MHILPRWLGSALLALRMMHHLQYWRSHIAVRAVVDLRRTFCHTTDQLYSFGGYKQFNLDYPTAQNVTHFDGQISAIAELMLESRITCNTEGKYAYACGGTWADAESFAGAAYEAYASAWVDVGTDACHCDIDIYASADAVISAWAEIWAGIYASIDDAACAGTGEHLCCAMRTYF